MSGSFDVDITLTVPGGPPGASGDFCVSQSQSDATGAVVRVVCKTGQFVSIEPRPGSPFLGVHGGAFRYDFANGIPANLRFHGGADPWVGPGTVTSIRVRYVQELESTVEMQVGF